MYAAMPGRRLKLPVVSRLTWAWFCFAALAAGLVVYSANDGGRTRAAVAMAIEGIERFAPPETPDAARAPDDAVDLLAEAAAPSEPYGVETEDALGAIAEPAPEILHPPADEILITVDGAPARAIGAPGLGGAAMSSVAIASPDEGLLQRSAYGRTPRISSDGRRASKVYARPFAAASEPSVALVVGGLGLNRALTERAIDELPPEVTLAFAPYAKDLIFWTKRARDAGHEIMIELPMENRTGDAEALGPAALLTSRTAEENLQRLDWILSRFEGYVGVTNYLGAKFSSDRVAMAPVLDRIEKAGLSYVDDSGLIQRLKTPKEFGTVNRLIDPGFGAAKGQTVKDLESLEKIAERDGDALGKTYVHDETLADVSQWARSLTGKGVVLTPASAVLAMRAGDR